MNKIILIGGAPGVGKSTLAKRIAEARGVNWISTDQIRTIMQKATSTDESPDLFFDARFSDSLEESIDLELKKAEIIWGGVFEFIEQNYPWEGCVIEGSAILPLFVARDLKDRQDMLPIFIVQSDESIMQVIEERSKDPWINTKTPEQKKMKAELTILFNDAIKNQAIKYSLPLYELDGFKDNYEKILNRATAF